MTRKSLFLITAAVAVMVFSGGAVVLYRYVAFQGARSVDWAGYSTAKVVFDEHAIATIEAVDWARAIEAQGFVTASERLWQMDLMRRNAGGRLSEWFGSRAISVDEKRRLEDWTAVADRAEKLLPVDERAVCDAYAKGVNHFIDRADGYWGIEYRLLGQRPESWRCRDSLFVLMLMGEDLSAAAADEAAQWTWRQHLPDDWQGFLFSQIHPWNAPLFGNSKKILRAPRALAKRALELSELERIRTVEPVVPGSNSWALSHSGGVFLANDPHLGRSVPQLWYAVRLRLSPTEWVVGASIPGLPGVVLGRNHAIAWAFTNAKEDVDDLLVETLSEDGRKYLARRVSGKEEWREIEERPYTIRIQGEASRSGIARFTHRGPLVQIPELGGGTFSRQWLVLRPEMLRIPTVTLARAKNWEEFNHAFDAMKVPAQTVLYVDRQGEVGVRVAGTGIDRRVSGLVPTDALRGEWLGFQDPSSRPRKKLPRSDSGGVSVASANERLWEDSLGHHWSSDQRRERIDAILRSETTPTRGTMERMQIDTFSRYHLLFAKWLSSHATRNGALVERLRNWDGDARTDPALMTQLFTADRAWVGLVLERVQTAFVPPTEKVEPYRWKLENAWQVALLESERGAEILGADAGQIADALLEKIERGLGAAQDYRRSNRWQSQHPLSSLPGIGYFFRIGEPEQPGWGSFVRVDKPKFGAATRLVWDMRSRDGGSWIFPVGQSGHVGSAHYSDLQKVWVTEARISVLPKEFEWGERVD